VKTIAALVALALAAPTATGADLTTQGIGYICGAERQPTASGGEARLVMLPGVGSGGFTVDTAKPEAQAWFDQGVQLYHAFYHEEAKRAFARATELDPHCALCAWGVALSLGPTLNFAVAPDQTAQALAAADRAAKLARADDTKAQGLITALQARYAPAGSPEAREVAYGHAMDALAQRFPQDDQIADLAAHALLTPARHDDYSGLPRAQALLETVLARSPDDTAAIHYYIHATEFAGHPALALPYAQRLAGLAPGASHLVHMAAHTMMHVGLYEQVALVDAEAMDVDAKEKTTMGYAGPLSVQRYYLHNYLFGMGGALMAGDGQLALKYADHAAVAFPASAASDRRLTADARRLVALGRFAPDRALKLSETPGDARILKVYRHYARGEAFAARGDAAGVSREADAIEVLGAEARKAHETGSVPIAEIAAHVLDGRAAMLRGRPRTAMALYAQAAATQEKAFPVDKNFDPPPWWYPVRRSLAAADLAAGKPDDAIREARAGLKDWPDDALALKVISEAQAKQGHAAEAQKTLAQAKRVWRGDLSKESLDLI
jgi:tetratricopeptide (TPR) repeat protein